MDEDEKMEQMCPKCREEVTSHKYCIRCGKEYSTTGEGGFVNPNFDVDRFNRLKAEADTETTRVEMK